MIHSLDLSTVLSSRNIQDELHRFPDVIFITDLSAVTAGPARRSNSDINESPLLTNRGAEYVWYNPYGRPVFCSDSDCSK